jgi:hypothetical protein
MTLQFLILSQISKMKKLSPDETKTFFFVVLLFSSGRKVNTPLKSKSYENCHKFWKKNLGQKNNLATV